MSYLKNILQTTQAMIKNSRHAFFIVDLGHLVHQHVAWTKRFPRVIPYYSVKCQPDIKVIDILNQIGTGFDCSSQVEIDLVEKAGVKASQIIFSNPFKFRKDIQYAHKTGLELTSYDSEGELEKLKKTWPKAKLLLRILIAESEDTARRYGSEKFGVKVDRIPKMLKAAEDHGFEVVGLSFHVGIMNDDWTLWNIALERSEKAKKKMIECGIFPRIINIGGGFPGKDIMSEDNTQEELFNKVTCRINKQLDEIFPVNDEHVIMGTPGTHYVFGAYTLATQIIGKRTVDVDSVISSTENRNVYYGTVEFSETNLKKLNEDKASNIKPPCSLSQGIVYIIDDGVYGSFNHLMFIDYTFSLLGITDRYGNMKKFSLRDLRYNSKMYGPTCDTFDLLLSCVKMPELHTHDWLIWSNMGAYTNAKRSSFNGIVSPKVHYFMSDEDKMLLKKLSAAKSNLNLF